MINRCRLGRSFDGGEEVALVNRAADGKGRVWSQKDQLDLIRTPPLSAALGSVQVKLSQV